jgi:hypothetical protein
MTTIGISENFPVSACTCFMGWLAHLLCYMTWVSCASPRLTGHCGEKFKVRCHMTATLSSGPLGVNSLKNEIFYQQRGPKPSNPNVKIAASLMEDLVCKGPSLLAWVLCSSASSSITSWWGFVAGPS